MSWIIFALLAALFEAFTVLFRKQSTIDQSNFHLVPILTIAAALPVTTSLGIYSLITNDFSLGASLFIVLGLSILLNSLAIASRYKALSTGEISKIEPLTLFQPALMLLTSWIILGEFPPFRGYLGVICVAIGAIILNLASKKLSPLDPLKALVKNPANRFMLITVLLWSVTTNLDKLAVRSLPVIVYIWWLHLGIVAVLMTLYRPAVRDFKHLISRRGIFIAGAGILGTFSLLFQTIALQSTYVTYAIAIRRLDIILVVILGHRFLREERFMSRLIGAIIMLAGAALVIF